MRPEHFQPQNFRFPPRTDSPPGWPSTTGRHLRLSKTSVFSSFYLYNNVCQQTAKYCRLSTVSAGKDTINNDNGQLTADYCRHFANPPDLSPDCQPENPSLKIVLPNTGPLHGYCLQKARRRLLPKTAPAFTNTYLKICDEVACCYAQVHPHFRKGTTFLGIRHRKAKKLFPSSRLFQWSGRLMPFFFEQVL